ncbi:ComEA family DNA-binding protein [Kineococcus sp. G2]|uniref:ComEA family DNA-binding protein n=1 Tax=Kineococcus sp. G2 TaxID=3127484 RepID=UPI00301E26B0
MPPPPLSDRVAAARARALAQRQLRAPAAPHRRGAPGAGPSALLGEALQRVEDRLPPGLRAVRWRVGPRAAAGVVLVTVLLAVGLGLLAWSTWPDGATTAPGRPVPARAGVPAPSAGATDAADPAAPTAPAATTAAPATTAVVSSTGTVVVHVAGRVLRPGLVTLPAGSRVAAALDAAGGATGEADLAALNLARPLTDGEQVLVPAPGEAAAPAPAAALPPAQGAAAGAGTAAPVDLDTATAEQLDALPGIGEVLAGRIVAWRQDNGGFTSVEELGEVPGIGPKLLDGLRDLVRA